MSSEDERADDQKIMSASEYVKLIHSNKQSSNTVNATPEDFFPDDVMYCSDQVTPEKSASKDVSQHSVNVAGDEQKRNQLLLKPHTATLAKLDPWNFRVNIADTPFTTLQQSLALSTIPSDICRLNLDISTLICLTSNICHGYNDVEFTHDILTDLAAEDRMTPLMPTLISFMNGE